MNMGRVGLLLKADVRLQIKCPEKWNLYKNLLYLKILLQIKMRDRQKRPKDGYLAFIVELSMWKMRLVEHTYKITAELEQDRQVNNHYIKELNKHHQEHHLKKYG